MSRNRKNGWIQKQQRFSAERREANEQRSKNALWIIAVIVVVGGTIASLAFHSKPGYGVFAAVGLVCFTVAMRMPGQRSLWSIYGRQGLVLPFACTLGGWLFGSANQFAAAMILGFVIYGAANVLHHMRETASA